MAAARQEDEGNGNAGPTVSMDPRLTVHWEMEFGRPIFSSGLIARLWVDKLKERWVRDELEAERAQPGSWPRRIRVVLEVVAVVLLLGAVGALAPFAGVWLLASLFAHPPMLVAVVAVLAIHFTLAAGYFAMALSLHREPAARRVLTWAVRVLGLVALPLTMYALAAPSTTRFEASAPDEVSSLRSWLVYYGYMFVNVIGLGAPQAVFGEIASLKPASLAAGAGTFWVNLLMAVGVFETLRVITAYYLLQRKSMACTVGELRRFLADPVNRNRYARASVVAKAVELETAHRDVSTPVSALDPARAWRLLSDGTLKTEDSAADDIAKAPDPAVRTTGPPPSAPNPNGVRVGWSPLFAAATFTLVLLVLTGTICTVTGIRISAPLPMAVIVAYAVYLTLFMLNMRGQRRMRSEQAAVAEQGAQPSSPGGPPGCDVPSPPSAGE